MQLSNRASSHLEIYDCSPEKVFGQYIAYYELPSSASSSDDNTLAVLLDDNLLRIDFRPKPLSVITYYIDRYTIEWMLIFYFIDKLNLNGRSLQELLSSILHTSNLSV